MVVLDGFIMVIIVVMLVVYSGIAVISPVNGSSDMFELK